MILMVGVGVIYSGVKPNIQLLRAYGQPFGKVNLAYAVIDNLDLLAAVATRLFRLMDDDFIYELMDDSGR